jgi:5-methylcytosine-specific restriction endonuclease McrA
LSRYDRRKKRFAQLKINQKLKKILLIDKPFVPCYFCRKIFLGCDLTVEHLVPLSEGGSSDLCNVSLCCPECNKKAGRISFLKLKITKRKI